MLVDCVGNKFMNGWVWGLIKETKGWSSLFLVYYDCIPLMSRYLPFPLLTSLPGCWDCCAGYTGWCDDVSCQFFTVRHPQHPTPCSVSHFLPQLQASWNPTAEPPAPFSPGLWKTQQSGKMQGGKSCPVAAEGFAGHCPGKILTLTLLWVTSWCVLHPHSILQYLKGNF